MSKINATYGSGVYLSPDFDYRKLEEQRRREKRPRKGRGDEDGDSSATDCRDEVRRQTFAIPFDLICTLCHRRVVRGSHVYVNRRATKEKYLGSIRIWELEFHCKFCDGLLYLLTDPETPKLTGGYKCAKNCERTRGDLYEMNRKNDAIRAQWEKDKADTETNPLEAMERENEATRRIAELNRNIEEHVESREAHEDSTLDLLRAVRARRTVQRQQTTTGHPEHSARGGFLSGKIAEYTPGAYVADRADDEEAQEEADFSAFTQSLSARAGDEDQDGSEDHSDASQDEQDDKDREDGSGSDSDQSHVSSPSSSSSSSDVDEVARALARYGGGSVGTSGPTKADLTHLMTAPASSSAEDVLSHSGTQGHRTEEPIASTASNIFLKDDDDDDDDDDEPNNVDGKGGQDASISAKTRTTASPVPLKAVSSLSRSPRAPRTLLGRLLDSDDDSA